MLFLCCLSSAIRENNDGIVSGRFDYIRDTNVFKQKQFNEEQKHQKQNYKKNRRSKVKNKSKYFFIAFYYFDNYGQFVQI